MNSHIKMGDIIKENSVMTKNMGKVFIDMKMESNTMEGGAKGNNMVKVNTPI